MESRVNAVRGGPGKVGSPVSYGLHDRVVRVEVLEKVKAAKQDTLEHFSADVLGVHGPQWNESNATLSSKHGHAASDALISNTLLSDQINATDVRTLRSTGAQPGNSAGRTANAFERTFVSGGWDQSTTRDPKREAMAATAFTEGAPRNAVRKAMDAKLTTTYVGPVDKQVLLSETLRQQKHETAPSVRLEALTQRFGEDGAHAMLQIERMKVPSRRPVQIRTRPEDIEAVRMLQGDNSDDDSRSGLGSMTQSQVTI